MSSNRRTIGRIMMALAILITTWAGGWVSAGQPVAHAEAPGEQEIVYLDNAGFIKVWDPYQMPGKDIVTWQSPDNGWLAIALGDFNGDGDDEIVAIKGSIARVYDPVLQPGWPAVTFEQTISPYSWEMVAAGDIDGDGKDEIILTRTASDPGNIIERLTVWDGGVNGTTWTKVRDNGYGCAWSGIALGRVNDDAVEDIGLIRTCTNPDDNRITILNPANNYVPLHDTGTYAGSWLDIEIGNTHIDGTNRDEIVVSRSGVGTSVESYYIFRWSSGTSLTDVTREKMYPYFTDIALGDINASGDKEVFLVRDPQTNSGIALTMRNYGSDATIAYDEAIGRAWRKVVAGDADGDNKAEVAILSSSEIRLYTEPASNKNYISLAGAYRTDGRSPIAMGNLDGGGVIAQPTLSVTPGSFTETLQTGASVDRTVNITNSGTSSSFTWTAAVISATPWLTLAGATSGATPGTLTLRINATGLAAGSYVGQVRIEAAAGVLNSPQTVTVNLTVQAPAQPQLVVTPQLFNEQVIAGDRVERTVTVGNSGAPGSFTWTATVISANTPWLTVNPATGNVPGSFTLAIDTAGLVPSPPIYIGRVRVAAAGMQGSPKDIDVNLEVLPRPFDVNPKTIVGVVINGQAPTLPPIEVVGTDVRWTAAVIPAGSLQTLQAAPVRSVARIEGGWQIGDGAEATIIQQVPWVTIDPTSGTAPSTITVTIDPTQLAPGMNRATIVVDGGVGSDPRFKGVDLYILVAQDQVLLPMVVKGGS